MKKIILFLLVWVGTNSLFAQMPTMASADNAVAFQKLHIDVTVMGSIAKSTWTMTFVNNAHRTMEGNLTFPLGEGIAVDQYAIDLNGKMRQAVPVEKAKATTVFEDISRRRIDPGILEKIDGNSFRTRVYPINGNGGTRMVSIGYQEELRFENGNVRMNLPLAFTNQLKEFTINVSVLESALPPQVISSEQLIFEKVGKTYKLSKTFKDYTPNKALTIIIPKQQDAPDILVEQVGSEYYFLANVYINGQAKEKPLAKHLTILWDQSLSCENRNLEKEMQLLDSYLKHIKETTVRVIGFSNEVVGDNSFRIMNGNWESLRKHLQSTVYDGATNYAALNLNKYLTNEFLLFSDGITNFVGDDLILGKSPIYCVASNVKSNFPALKSIAMRSKGEFINLNEIEVKQGVQALISQPFKFLGIKNISESTRASALVMKNAELYPSIPTLINNSFLLTGHVSDLTQPLVLQFGYGNQVTEERVLKIQDISISNQGIDRFWAAKKIEELDLDYTKNKEEIENLGKKYGIVTRNTSLMVLELVSDYIRYNIDPPAELQEEYNRLMGRTPKSTQNFEHSTFTLDYLVKRWDSWYNWKQPIQPQHTSRLTPTPKKAPVKYKNGKKFIPPVIVADNMIVEENEMKMQESASFDELVVIGYGTTKKSELTGSVSQVKSEDLKGQKEIAPPSAKQIATPTNNGSSEIISPATPNIQPSESSFKVHVKGEDTYMPLIMTAGNSYDKYLELRAKHRSSTKFYFDVSQFFADKGQSDIAIRILSNIAELDQENYELYKGLGFKLKAMGQHHAASYVFKKVLVWRPMEPQPYRDYGLSLADEGKVQQGLDVLVEGITRKYASNIPSLFHGVQEIFFTDINGLIAKNPRLKIDPKIKAYVKPVASDVRVILSWNLGDSYIDLHITDPNGQFCDYRHLTTGTGGQFSTDFGGGYGPREFIQRKGVKGKYKIQTNYYGDNIQKVAGPAMVMVEVYKNFATDKETRTIVALHPSTQRGNMFDIGEVVWE